MDLHPLDKVSAETVLTTDTAIKAFLANLYSHAPWHDFNYVPLVERTVTTSTETMGLTQDHMCDNCCHSLVSAVALGFTFWDDRYKFIRDVNFLASELENIQGISEERKNTLLGETHFLRAWAYHDLATTWGGVPLIKESQEYHGDPSTLIVQRSTEKDTWDFICSEFQAAADLLPEARELDEIRFANKYAALGMLSRSALFAASVAKFGYKAALVGPAVDEKLAGIDASYANDYYKICLDACKAIMDSGRYGLFRPTPANKQEAIDNIMEMFQDVDIATEECILTCGYGPISIGGGHSLEWYNGPYQTRESSLVPCLSQPMINLVDNYECYSRPGEDGDIQTRKDGNLGNAGYDPNAEYYHFTNAYDIFNDKDARLWATVVLPFTEWKGKTIRIQNGFILDDGTPDIGGVATTATKNGVTYYKFGASTVEEYSGFDILNAAAMTRTGFCYKKYLNPVSSGVASTGLGKSTQDFPELRYAEILLNYAEAAVESGLGDQSLATQCLNATRRRAAFTTDIPLTVKNVLRERRSEFPFEGKRYDDLRRRREFHEVYDHFEVNAFNPILDMRTDPPQFIYVRTLANFEAGLSYNYFTMQYYQSIPISASTPLVQNPGW